MLVCYDEGIIKDGNLKVMSIIISLVTLYIAPPKIYWEAKNEGKKCDKQTETLRQTA